MGALEELMHCTGISDLALRIHIHVVPIEKPCAGSEHGNRKREVMGDIFSNSQTQHLDMNTILINIIYVIFVVTLWCFRRPFICLHLGYLGYFQDVSTQHLRASTNGRPVWVRFPLAKQAEIDCNASPATRTQTGNMWRSWIWVQGVIPELFYCSNLSWLDECLRLILWANSPWLAAKRWPAARAWKVINQWGSHESNWVPRWFPRRARGSPEELALGLGVQQMNQSWAAGGDHPTRVTAPNIWIKRPHELTWTNDQMTTTIYLDIE